MRMETLDLVTDGDVHGPWKLRHFALFDHFFYLSEKVLNDDKNWTNWYMSMHMISSIPSKNIWWEKHYRKVPKVTTPRK